MKQATLLLSLLFTATVAWGAHLAISTTGMTGGARTNKPVRLTLTDTNYVVSGQFIGMEPLSTNTDYAGACIISNFVGGHCILTIGGNPPATWMLSVPITNGLVDASTCATNRAGLSYSPWSDLRYISQPGGSNLVTWTNGGRVYIAATGTGSGTWPVLISNLVTNPNTSWTNTLVQGANVTLTTNANGTVTLAATIFGSYASLEDATNIVRALALLTAGNRGTNVVLVNATNLGTITMATRPGLGTNLPIILDGDGTVISASWPVVTATNAIANLNGKGTNTSFFSDLFPYGGITFPETGISRLDTVMGVPLDLPPGFITQRGFITNGLYVGGDETNVGNMYLQGTLTGGDGNLKLGLPGHIITFGGLPVFGSWFTSLLLPDSATNNLGASKRLKSSSNVTLTTNASDIVVDLASNIDLGTLSVGALTVSNVSTNKPLIFGGDSNLTSVDWPTVGTTLNVSNNVTASNFWGRSNLKWWGAAGDGVTDDSHAISNWLAYIRQGITGFVPPGLYRTVAQDCTTVSSVNETDPAATFGVHPSYHIVGLSFPSYPFFRPIYNTVTTNATFICFEDGPPAFDFIGAKGVKLENIVFTTEGTNRPECAVLFGRHGAYDGSSGMQEFINCAFSGEYQIASMVNLGADFATYYKCVWYAGMPWSTDQQIGFYSAYQTNTWTTINGVSKAIWSKFRPFTTGVCQGGMALNDWNQCSWLNENTNQGMNMVLETSAGTIRNSFFAVTGGSTNNVKLVFSGGPLSFENISIEGWGTNITRIPNFVEFATSGGIFQDITFKDCLILSPLYGQVNTYVTGLRIENCSWWPCGTNMNLSTLRNSYIQGGGYPQDGSGYLSEGATNVGTWVVRDIADNNTWVNVWQTNVMGTKQQHATYLTPNAEHQVESLVSKSIYSSRSIGTTAYLETPISTELVVNGGCANTNGWWTTAGLGNAIESVAGGVAGNCLLVTNGNLAQPGAAQQIITTVAGAAYKLTFYGRMENTNTYGWCAMVGTVEGGYDLHFGGIHKETNWTQVSAIFDATTTTSYLNLRCYDTNAGSAAFFDSISVVRVPSGNISARGLFTGDGGTNGVKINSDGAVGIGGEPLYSPTYLFELRGNGLVIGNYNITGAAEIDGNLGIGTNSPQSRLHVTADNSVDKILIAGTTNRPALMSLDTNGDMKITGTLTSPALVTSNATFHQSTATTVPVVIQPAVGSTTNRFTVNDTNGNPKVLVDSMGRVGIGTNLPQALLHVRGTNGPSQYIVQVENPMVANKTNTFIIATNNYVGVNNSAPGYQLDVTGVINGSSTVKSGSGFDGPSFSSQATYLAGISSGGYSMVLGNSTYSDVGGLVFGTNHLCGAASWTFPMLRKINASGTQRAYLSIVSATNGYGADLLVTSNLNVGGVVAISNTLSVSSGGGLNPVGCYGSLMMNSTNLIVCAGTTEVYTNIAGSFGFGVIATNGFYGATNAQDSGALTNLYAGYYRVQANISYQGADSQAYECSIFTNLVECEILAFKDTFDTPARLRNGSTCGIIYLPAGCRTSLKIQDFGAGSSVSVHRATLTIGTP